MSNIKQLDKSYNNVIKSKNKKDILKFMTSVSENITILNSKIDTCIQLYNSIILDMTKKIQNSFPKDILLKLQSSIIINIIKLKTNTQELINLFIMNIYKNDEYRINILQGNDSFFIQDIHNIHNNHKDHNNHNDHKEHNNHNDHKEHNNHNDLDKLNIIYQIKKYWLNMPSHIQDYLKLSLKTLVQLSEQYINYKSDVYKLNDMIKIINNY